MFQIKHDQVYISTPSTGYINVIIKPIGGDRTDWIIKSIKNVIHGNFKLGSGNNHKGNERYLSLNGKFNNAGYIIESDRA